MGPGPTFIIRWGDFGRKVHWFCGKTRFLKRIHTPLKIHILNPNMEVDGRWFSFSTGWFLGSMLLYEGVSGTIYFFSSCGIGRYNSTEAIASTCNQSTHGIWHSESVSENLFDTKKGWNHKKLNGFCFFKPNCKLCANWWGKYGKIPKVFHTSQGNCQANSHHFLDSWRLVQNFKEKHFFDANAPFFSV